MNTPDLAVRALIVKVVANLTDAAKDARKKDLEEVMSNGERHYGYDPDNPDVELGYVLRTKPKGSAAVTDREKFTAWMAETYPEQVKTMATITDLAAAVEVLREHAPSLLTMETVVQPWAESAVLLFTIAAKQPCGPSKELDVPGIGYKPPKPGTVTVNPSPGAAAVVADLLSRGRIDLPTGEVLALESSS
jgi:hypothetical protein